MYFDVKLMGYNIENGGILISIFKKKEEEIIASTYLKNRKQKTKNFLQTTIADEQEPSETEEMYLPKPRN